MEPFFFDCLTDAQLWSLFDAGVLQGCLLPLETYTRLTRIAPDYGCHLFTWPIGMNPPSLQEIVSGGAVRGDALPAQPPSDDLEMPVSAQGVRSVIEAFCAHVDGDRSPEDHRIHIIATTPRLELRPGPYLEPQTRDLTAMSLAELGAYLDDVLQLDEGAETDAATSSDSS